jgi:hypothetical protein
MKKRVVYVLRDKPNLGKKTVLLDGGITFQRILQLARQKFSVCKLNAFCQSDDTDKDSATGEEAAKTTAVASQGAFKADVFESYVIWMSANKSGTAKGGMSSAVLRLTSEERTPTEKSIHAKERVVERYRDRLQEFHRSMYMGNDCLYYERNRCILVVEGRLLIECTGNFRHVLRLQECEKSPGEPHFFLPHFHVCDGFGGHVRRPWLDSPHSIPPCKFQRINRTLFRR